MAQYPAETQLAEDLFLALNASPHDSTLASASTPPRRRRRNKPTVSVERSVERCECAWMECMLTHHCRAAQLPILCGAKSEVRSRPSILQDMVSLVKF